MPGLADAPVTLILLLINVLVSGYALYSDPSLIERLSFRPARIRDNKEYYRLITAGFVHVGLWHLAFNMITLYFFGPLLEGVLGSFKFILLYFGSELAAHGLTMWTQRDNYQYAAVGASGAVSGVLFAFCLFAPFSMLYVFFAIPMPAILFAVLYVGGSIYAMKQAREQGAMGGIAHDAHLGGALGGLALTLLLEPRALSIFFGQIGRFFG